MQQPYLPIPRPSVQNRAKGRGGGTKLQKPGRQQQTERFGGSFERIEQLITEGRVGELRDDPTSLAPERAIVFEVAGSGIPAFAEKARQIGLEFLFEEEGEETDAHGFAVIDREGNQRPEKPVPAHFYLVMPDETSLRELVTLWNRFKRNEAFPHGYAKWRDLFDHLIDVRPWGARDRINPGDQAFFAELLETQPDQMLRAEVELWFSNSEETNGRRFQSVAEAVRTSGGEVLFTSTIQEIRYAALLANLPRAAVQSLIDLGDVALLNTDGVMFVRPQSTASTPELEEEELDDSPPTDDVAVLGEPLVALIDGVPIQNHTLLQGRLTLDDPDGLEKRYASVASRRHGTEMASLIIHGDLSVPSTPITTRLYVRPVLCCEGAQTHEHFPPESLLVDYVYRAVRRLFEGEGELPASAPSVKVINISLGDGSRPFARRMSPWARLLDYLSWRYGVLFIVSAGNVATSFELPSFATLTDYRNATDDEREIACVIALNSQAGDRCLLSPSESLNALTIGSSHSDNVATGALHAGLVDPYHSPSMPTVISGLGLGFRSAIKPELLVGGGRTLLRARATVPLRVEPVQSPGRFAGIAAAAPDPQGRLDQSANIYGTSVAAALATRSAHQILDAVLDSAALGETDPQFWPLYAKALLVHHSRVTPVTYRRLETLFRNGQSSRALKRDIARFLTFGCLDPHFEPGSTDQHAIMVGHGLIEKDQGHLFRLPLPQSLGGNIGYRAMTVTLAWFSPINPSHQLYRMAKLVARLPQVGGMDGNNTDQPDDHSRGKGTVFHARFDGSSNVAVANGATADIVVDCLAQAGELDETIPYAIAVSFEVGVNSGIDLYADVRARLAVRVQGQP